jgi:GTP-binding protein Era
MRRSDAKREGLPESGHLTELRAYLPNVDHTLLVVDAAKKLTDSVRETLVELMLLALQAQGRHEFSAHEPSASICSSEDQMYDDDALDFENEIEANAKKPMHYRKFSVVLNKVDLVHPKSELLEVAAQIGDLAETCLERLLESGSSNISIHDQLPMFFYTSALKEEGTNDLLHYLLDLSSPCDVWEVEPGQSTDMTPEERVQEIVREKLYRCLHKEVPYRIEQRNTLLRAVALDNQFAKTSKNSLSRSMGIMVHQDLVLRTKSHLELVRGSGGQTLERIQESAQKDLERIFGCRVKLQLHVKHSKSKSR